MCMNFDKLVNQLGHLPFFDMVMVLQLSGEDKSKVRTQLHRWIKSGKLISLRREMYTLADRYRKAPLYPTLLANELYTPSYLSGLWALSYFGLIPEKVVIYTSITPRVPRSFSNSFGIFQYSNVKQSYFFGYSAYEIQQQNIWLSDPEKALLDLWHLSKGEWSFERMLNMRFQQCELVNFEKLCGYAVKFKSPRLRKAIENWKSLTEMEEEESIEP